ncbi:O-antigen ligase family protein [Arthrobacter sp. RT-1]|uniref:O-antigen ligase family protein n=1 Tax=Arthrobacter sp. RT-1 TaxID=2292263 RepID=UPI000E1F9E89|nr:O-antigen ligase family protein [Arthrobacter sp. RT-1]RDV08127.1 O-antigen ligase family protein [Arthrobacter sp. RT-1]
MTLRGDQLTAAAKDQPRVGIRTLLMAVLAGFSTFDPTYTLSIGPTIAVLVLILGRPLALKLNAPVIFAALFVLWAWISLLWTPDEDFTRATAVLWTNLLVIFVAAYDLIQTRAQLKVLAAGFVVGAIITVAKSLFFGPEVSEAAETAGRAAFGNANVNYVAYALTTALALVVVLWGARTKTKSSFLLLGGAAAVLIPGLIATDTRAAQLGLAFLAAWIIICGVSRRRPLKLVVTIVLAATFCLVTGVADEASLAFESGTRVTGDWSGRLVIWPMARDMWADNPIIGIGAGAFIVTNGIGVGAHNIILQTGTGLGIIGVGLSGALIWTALAGKPADRSPRRKLLVGAYLAACSPLFLTGMWETAPAAWFGIAIIARLRVLEPGVQGQAAPGLDLAHPNFKKLPEWAKPHSSPLRSRARVSDATLPG